MELSAQQIADFLGGTVDGNPEVKVSNFSKIEEGQPGTLTFLANPKYEHYIYNTEASIVLVNNDFSPAEQITATLVKVENAYSALQNLKRPEFLQPHLSQLLPHWEKVALSAILHISGIMSDWERIVRYIPTHISGIM